MFQRVLPVALAALLLAGCGAQRGLNTPGIGGARAGAAVGAQSYAGVDKGIRAAFIYVFKQMDRDGSGFLTEDEIMPNLLKLPLNAGAEPTMQLDKNHDGKVSLAEFIRPELRTTVVTQFRVSMAKMFAELDVNGDRFLVPEELTNAGITFEQADLNKNGKVTLSEFEDGVAGLLIEGKGFGVTPPLPQPPVAPAVEPIGPAVEPLN